MIVVDASFVFAALLNLGDAAPAFVAAAARLGGLCAPHLIDPEVASVIRGALHRGDIDETDARRALAELQAAPIRRAAQTALLPRIWALRFNFSAYDATYVALAESLDAPLLTRDERMARAVAAFTRVQLA